MHGVYTHTRTHTRSHTRTEISIVHNKLFAAHTTQHNTHTDNTHTDRGILESKNTSSFSVVGVIPCCIYLCMLEL